MSIENARLAYPVLVKVAQEQSQAVRDGRGNSWTTYDDLCRLLAEIGMKESPRTIMAKVLRDLQAACVEKEMPDLTSLVIQKPRTRADTGDLVRPTDAWWQIYVEREQATAGDVGFWFNCYRTARDHDAWPEAPFF